ncbi:MAG TPA: hypothetical protein VIL63_03845 [Terriglobales bacterium]
MNDIKVLTILISLFVSGLQAQSSGAQCERGEFSGEAKQGLAFSRELVGGIKFSVDPMQLKEDPRWGSFQIRVLGTDQPVFDFNLSDRNWLLATDFWSSFIGGVNVDLKAALQYRLRNLIFPTSFKNKEKLRIVADALHGAKGKDEIEKSVNALRAIPLGVMQFEITDYAIGDGERPTSIEWVKFTVTVTFPREFSSVGPLLVSDAECPAIPDEVIENIRGTERHKPSVAPIA